MLIGIYDNSGTQGGVQGIFRSIGGFPFKFVFSLYLTGLLAEPADTAPPVSCGVPTQNDTSFMVVTNNSSPNACDPVELTVTGGTRPYNLTWVVQGDLEYTARLGPDDDQYVWYANAVPNQFLVGM